MNRIDMLSLAENFAIASGLGEKFKEEYEFQRELLPVAESVFVALQCLDLWDNFVVVRNTQPGWNSKMRTGMEIAYDAGEVVREANAKMDSGDEPLTVNESAAWLVNMSEVWVLQSNQQESVAFSLR